MTGDFFTQRIKRGLVRRFNNLKIAGTAKKVAKRAPAPKGQPVVFFKASTGIDDLSWNSGFHLLASWALRLQGVPVVYFACQSGMSHCVLGTNRDDPHKPPPCKSCIHQSQTLYTDAAPHWFTFERDQELERLLQNLSVEDLSKFEWMVKKGRVAAGKGSAAKAVRMPLGALCLPALRWILRIHHLDDEAQTRYLLREYMLSAWNIALKFSRFLDKTRPRAVVLFNGQFFPEATARWVAQQRGLRVITHEVGLQPASAFFTDGEATAYPIRIPAAFELSAAQNVRLDEYLQKRFQGQFTMAGIQFWPAMRGLDEPFRKKAARFKQIVSVFTNVIFDTSQPHANTVFTDMFAWLNMVLDVIKAHPETLFVIRAHPDETRTRKESRETVQGWVEDQGVNQLKNVSLVAPTEYMSSYELIQHSKFVMVYNSTIGLEASIMGKPVLCGGKARFTQYPTVFFPQTVKQQRRKMEEFLSAETIEVPPEYKRNARRFLYYQLFRTSLPFGEFLAPSVRTTQSRLKSFALDMLSPEQSPAINAISTGVLSKGDFLLED